MSFKNNFNTLQLQYFYVKDLDELIWQIIPANDFYTNHNHPTGEQLVVQ